ncbi:AAA family ATPase [Arthrobacter zhaoguopingii]|uniref:AAA family ATPase n=1 Tax=Arthrobacter zhaoguopingii TaxID=2681491 RepID=UPI00135CC48B|nr:P-loop NTPase [Arthrobacter zhaoguopingii]
MSGPVIPVVTVGPAAGEYVPGLEKLHGPVTVVRRCEGVPELLAAGQAGLARAAILSPGTGELTVSLLERLRDTGIAVVVLAGEDEPAAGDGAPGVLRAPPGIAPGPLAELVAAAVESLSGAERSPGARTGTSAYADPAAALPPPGNAAPPLSDEPGGGTVTAVWGPTGAPGRTTVAVNMAAELAAAGSTVLLVDADTYGASAAAFLGLLDEAAGLAQACRLADQGTLAPDGLRRVASTVAVGGGRLSVLTGLTRPDRWPELRPAALARVLECARACAAVTIVDCGFCLEADEELSFDTAAPRRNGAALRCLELADSVLAVGAADAVGVPRLVRSLAVLAEAVPSAEPRVVLNKVRAGSVGRSPEDQLREAWERFGPGTAISAFLPADFPAADEALLAGSVLAETAPSSALRKAIAGLVDVTVEQRQRRRIGWSSNEVKFSWMPVRLPR